MGEESGIVSAPAGWYPQADGTQRYWNGAAWDGPGQAVVQGYGTVAQPAPYPVAVAPAVAVMPKNPGLALVASFFIPGLGQLINGEVGKGIGIFVGYVVSLVLIVVFIGIFGALGFWIWGMVDAYQSAQAWNRRFGILS